MDSTDLRYLLDLVDRRIERSSPMTAEYWRGYCRGIREYFHHVVDEPAPDPLRGSPDAGRDEAILEAYARGYCDGLKGRLS